MMDTIKSNYKKPLELGAEAPPVPSDFLTIAGFGRVYQHFRISK